MAAACLAVGPASHLRRVHLLLGQLAVHVDPLAKHEDVVLRHGGVQVRRQKQRGTERRVLWAPQASRGREHEAMLHTSLGFLGIDGPSSANSRGGRCG